MGIKSYALQEVKFMGHEGKYPKDEDGNLKRHIVRGIFFDPPDYIKMIPVEDANKLVRRWPVMYEFVNPDDAKMETILDKALERTDELEQVIIKQGKQIEKLIEKMTKLKNK